MICCLSVIIRVVSWLPSCTPLFRAARKYLTVCRESTHEGFDFFWNKPGILLMEEVQGVIGILGQGKIYPKPEAPISMVAGHRFATF